MTRSVLRHRRPSTVSERPSPGRGRAWTVSRLTLLLALLVAALTLAIPTAALADGDPGSDELVYQNLYVSSGTGLSASQQVELGRFLAATEKAGAPVKVALISNTTGLGTVTRLWNNPQGYAAYLGTELEDTYSGRLLVVMPKGFGYYWWAKGGKSLLGADLMATAVVHSHTRLLGATGKAAVTSIMTAVERIENAAGIPTTTLLRDMHASGSIAGDSGADTSSSENGSPAQTLPAASPASGSKHKLPTGVFAVFLIAFGLLYVAWRTGRLKPFIANLRERRRHAGAAAPTARADRGGLFGLGISPFALIPTGFLVLAIIVLVAAGGSGSGPSAAQLSNAADNPALDAGTSLGDTVTAPNFTLYNQAGRPVSLKQYRGKVVILSFVDAECQTICPLTTQAMLDAKRSLGAAGKNVVLLGVDANWKSTQIADVINYTDLHGMQGQWNFLTSPDRLGPLEKVWNEYHVNEYTHQDEQNSNDINHEAATYLIDPQGKERVVFETQTNYAAIPQLGQLLARDAAALLPGHPKVNTSYSYTQVKGITPTQTVTIPKSGGGTMTLQPGKPHLYVFFATWDVQSTQLAAHMEQLDQYEEQAKRDGLPQLTAIDEGSVEPNSAALPDYLKSLATPLNYPVGIDDTGRIADGYEVEGEPWFVLVNGAGRIVWYQEVYTQLWPSLSSLAPTIRGALKRTSSAALSSKAVTEDLGGSPAPLAKLHAQTGEVLPGESAALAARIKSLRGFPVVVNVWGAWCTECQAEFKYFEQASAQFGKDVAFIGADYNDQTQDAISFLKRHRVWYPSYAIPGGGMNNILSGGVIGTPTTIFYNAAGKQTLAWINPFTSQSTLDYYIEHYALGSSGCTACK